MWKYAGELRLGDVWTERSGGNAGRDFRVVTIGPGPAATMITVTGSCVITGEMRTMDFLLVNRVMVCASDDGSKKAVSSG
jgi:hypothetical protein